MIIKQQLHRSILRSEKAYEHYKEHKRYHQALHIYKANKQVYELLVSFYLECEEEIITQVLEYIFHLEDWFEQFKELELKKLKLNDEFVFERLEFGIAYPVKFKELLKHK